MQDMIFERGDNAPIHYRFRQGRRDCRHLLIVMSGFNIPDPTVYDFTQVLDHCHSHILWIKDDFHALPAYYLCHRMSFDIELGVSLLIQGVMNFLNQPVASIVGGSKGGSMALYYGVKHRLPHIISAVPQFNIGDYVAEGSYWQHVGENMMGELTAKNIARLNRKLPDMLKNSDDKKNHIYLFTSPSDAQYDTEIVANLPLFQPYPHFNLIESLSPLITRHDQVMAYNIPLILSLIYQFEHNIAPHWGHVRNGSAW